MPAILIQVNSVANNGTNSRPVGLATVQVGDVIVVGSTSFFGGVGAACTDSLGNTYLGPFQTNGSFGVIATFYCVSAFAGAPTITVTGPGPSIYVIAANYRGAGIFDQATVTIGYYTPTLPYLIGMGTSYFTLADTLVTSFMYHSSVAAGVTSDSGDTLVLRNDRIIMFDRLATGPGASSVKVKTTDGTDVNEMPMVVLTFSSPLTRPSGTAEQYALRPGHGFEGATSSVFKDANPLVASLPYYPQLGSLICVGCSYSDCAASVLSVRDDYGNTYTQDIDSFGDHGDTHIALFHGTITALPPPGQIFKVQMDADVSLCGAFAYQTTNIAIAEVAVATSIAGVRAAAWNSDILADPDITSITDTIAAVPANTFLFAMVAYNGSINQQSITWAPLVSFTIQQQSTFIQFPFTPGNFDRVGVSAVMSKRANVAGNYDAQAIGTISGTFSEGGSIALLAVSLTIPNPPPGPGGRRAAAQVPNQFDFCIHRENRLYCSIDIARLTCGNIPACFTVDEREWGAAS